MNHGRCNNGVASHECDGYVDIAIRDLAMWRTSRGMEPPRCSPGCYRHACMDHGRYIHGGAITVVRAMCRSHARKIHCRYNHGSVNYHGATRTVRAMSLCDEAIRQGVAAEGEEGGNEDGEGVGMLDYLVSSPLAAQDRLSSVGVVGNALQSCY